MSFGAPSAGAGDCQETSPGSFDFVCSGGVPAGGSLPALRIDPLLSGPFYADIIVNTEPGFGVDVITAIPLPVDGAISIREAPASVVINDPHGSLIRHDSSSGISVETDFNQIPAPIPGGPDPFETISITTTGHVVGGGGDGILAWMREDVDPTTRLFDDIRLNDITINAVDVTGSVNGISARQFREGGILIDASGTVTGETGAGVFAQMGDLEQFFDSRPISLSVNEVSGGSHGIFAVQEGPPIDPNPLSFGTVDITATGTVSGDIGIYAVSRNADFRNPSSITAVDVMGNDTGIIVQSLEQFSIETTGSVTGVVGDGIVATVDLGRLDIMTGPVSANYTGILAEARDGLTGSTDGREGVLSITATGAVAGSAGTAPMSDPSRPADGIRAFAGRDDLSITATDVSGRDFGIYAEGKGLRLDVTTTGDVVSTQGTGIYLDHSSDAGVNERIVVKAHNVQGAISGIVTKERFGSTDITVTGAVEGGSGVGIETQTDVPSSISSEARITLKNGASVSSQSGIAITNDETNSILTVESGAGVVGQINLGGGDDHVAFNGGDFSGVTRFDGGAGNNDSLSFDGSSGTLDGTTVMGMEQVSIGTSTRIDLINRLVASQLSISGGGTLAGDASLTGNLQLSSNANLIIGASPGTFTVDGAAQSDAGATLFFEIGGLVGGVDYDQLIINGPADFAAGTHINIGSFEGFQAEIGDSFDLILAESFGSLSAMDFFFSLAPDLLEAGSRWRATIVDRGALQALQLDIAAVPLPAAGILWLSGLAAFAGLRARAARRKKLPA
ncbi:MAG: hypothetical protein AAF337_01960 [Pseudomonadota bacterium]